MQTRAALVRIHDVDSLTYGWQARWSVERGDPWTRGAKYRSKLFSYRKHGGRDAAKRAAQAWLRQQAKWWRQRNGRTA